MSNPRATVTYIATQCTILGVPNGEIIRDWILSASTKELLEFLSVVGYASNWHQLASNVLQQKSIAELTDYSRNQVEHTKKLTEQTDILVTESQNLGRLTWGLLILTVFLAILTAALLCVDCRHEHEPQQTSTATK